MATWTHDSLPALLAEAREGDRLILVSTSGARTHLALVRGEEPLGVGDLVAWTSLVGTAAVGQRTGTTIQCYAGLADQVGGPLPAHRILHPESAQLRGGRWICPKLDALGTVPDSVARVLQAVEALP